jgi:hypothetical protein
VVRLFGVDSVPCMTYSSDFTFVVQGPVVAGSPLTTHDCTRSIRRFFPESRIILSTWEGSNVTGIDCDELLLNVDPGAPCDSCFPGSPYNRPNSVNRMIVSTAAGIAASRTPWSVRVRSDFVFTTAALLELDSTCRELFGKTDPRWQVFEEPILCPSLYAVDTFKQPLAYHPSDMLHVGRTTDLRRLWNAPLMTPGQLAFCIHNDLDNHEYRLAMQFVPEQWVWLSCLSRAGIACHTPSWYYHISPAIEHDSIRLLLNNFMVVDYRDCGVTSRFDADADSSKRTWTAIDFQAAYDRIVLAQPPRSPRSLKHFSRRWYSSRWRKWLINARVRKDQAWIRLAGFTIDFSAWMQPWTLRGRDGRRLWYCCHAVRRFIVDVRYCCFTCDIQILGIRFRLGGD